MANFGRTGNAAGAENERVASLGSKRRRWLRGLRGCEAEVQSISIQDKKMNSNLKMLAVEGSKLRPEEVRVPVERLPGRSRHQGAAGVVEEQRVNATARRRTGQPTTDFQSTETNDRTGRGGMRPSWGRRRTRRKEGQGRGDEGGGEGEDAEHVSKETQG